MNLASHQEKGEDRRPILKKLRAALPRSFRGQHGKKMACARGNWDPREEQHPFRPNPNGFGDRTTTSRRLLTGAEVRRSFISISDRQQNILSRELH